MNRKAKKRPSRMKFKMREIRKIAEEYPVGIRAILGALKAKVYKNEN